MKPANSVKRAGKTGSLCLKTMALNVLKVDLAVSDIPQGNITYRWFKCFGLGNGAAGVVKELGSSPSLSLSGLQGSYINCEVTLTVNGKSKTFFPKAICNGELSDGIYVRPRIG